MFKKKAKQEIFFILFTVTSLVHLVQSASPGKLQEVLAAFAIDSSDFFD